MQQPERKPRVLVLSSTFPRWAEDTEPRFILDLCRYLQEHAEILVLAPHAPGAAFQETIGGVAVQRFRYFVTRWQGITYRGGIVARIRARPWRVLQLPFLVLSLWWNSRRLFREWKPDVIHAHWLIPQGLVACLISRKRAPVVCTSHGGDLYGLQSGLARRIKAWVLANSSVVTVVSGNMLPSVRAISPEVVVKVIPMGTDVSTLFLPPESEAARSRNELVFVGRLVEKKGLGYLLDAFAIVLQSRGDLRLTILGDGPLREAMYQRTIELGIQESTNLLGSLPHSQLRAIYQRAALAVFPFIVARDGDQEGFGLVIAEAMGCGCPVVASDIPAVRETIEPGVTGILTPPADSLALADAILRCLADDALRCNLAESALKKVRSRFDWPIIADQYSEVLRTAWAGKASIIR